MVLGGGWWRYWCWHCLLLGLEVWAQQQQQELPREDVGLPTGDEDETDPTWEYSDVPGETAAYTWPELFLADTDSLTQATASFWRPKEATVWPNPMGTNDTPPDPDMTRYTPFDPRVWSNATEVPSRNYGHVLLAQGYYMLVQVNGDYISCSRLIFQETIFDYYQTKECLPSYNKNWFWTYPWVPEIVHTLQVKDRSSKKLLVVESYYSLPEEAPHLFPITIKTGLGWVQVTFKPPIEKGPSLVGYAIFYKTSLEGRLTERWLDVISMYVVYNEMFPYVRPTHPCKDFRKDRTFCILIMDHVGAMEMASNPDDIHMQMSAFRVGPGPWKPHVVKHWTRPPFNEVCYWATEQDCPGIMETGGKRVDYAAREMYQPAVVTTKRPQLGAVIVNQKDLDTFPNASLAPVSLRGLRSEDLVVAFAGLTLLLLVIGTPCVYFLGQRAGEAAGEGRWARLASRPGVVHVPLGHGGGRRRGGRRWHPRRSRPAR